MQIIDAYIKLLKAQEGLIKRPGGMVYLESVCITALITRMGKRMRPLKPITLTVALPSVQRTRWYGDGAKLIHRFNDV